MANNLPPTALLCDLGKVLVDFDRDKFGLEFFRLFARKLTSDELGELSELRKQFESGSILPTELWEQSYTLLKLEQPQFADFKRVWTSIFSPFRDTIKLLQEVSERQNFAVILVSDTDPWCFNYCMENYGLSSLVHGAVCSFQEDVNPKWKDASMWLKARRLAEDYLGGPAEIVLAIDDLEAHIISASSCGAATEVHLHQDAQGLKDCLKSLENYKYR